MAGLAWALEGLRNDWLDGHGMTKLTSMTVGPERYDAETTGIARMLQPMVPQPAGQPAGPQRAGKAS